MRKIVCDPLRSPREFVIIGSPSVFPSLLSAHLLCRGLYLRVELRSPSVELKFLGGKVPSWKVLCEHSGNPSV